MPKSKKRKKKAHSSGLPRVQARGFDYGCTSYAMAVASFEFSGYLSAASIEGVVYGWAWSEAVTQWVPTISLVARNGDKLAKAFEMFNFWSDMTDPDSVELTFIFRKSGGYLLAISPEVTRLERRCLGFDRTLSPLAVAPTWVKPIDSVNPFLLEIRDRATDPIAPFLFGGVVYAGLRGNLSSFSEPELQKIEGLRELLKFDVAFLDEDEIEPNTNGWLALIAGGDRPSPKFPKKPPKPRPEEIAKQRAKLLRYHFPVTLERLRRSSEFPRVAIDLQREGVRKWQVEQALCNLVLSRDLGHQDHYLGLSRRKVQSIVLEALQYRYELATMGELPQIDIDSVRAQVVADGIALLQFLGRKAHRDLAFIQAALESVSALDASSAISDLPGNLI